MVVDAPAPGPEGAILAVEEAIDRLHRERVEDAPDSALGEEIVALRRLIDQLEAESCRRIRVFEAHRAYLREGATTMVSWLQDRCGLSASAAYRRAEVSRQLPKIPEAMPALEDARIGFSHAVVLARTVTDLGADRARQSAPELMDVARRAGPDSCAS